MYQLIVYKFEPLSEEEKKESEFRNRRGMDTLYPNQLGREDYKSVKSLDVSLTDSEFAAIKKAALSVM
jgi:hypothetical protein